MTSSKRVPPDFTDCPCAGKTLNKLVQPAILTVLAQKRLHGYAIVREVAEMPMFDGETPDATGIYRYLKSMEDSGFVTSSWDLPDAGPAKRQYELTSEGRGCLRRWTETLEAHRQAIGRLLSLARRAATASETGASAL